MKRPQRREADRIEHAFPDDARPLYFLPKDDLAREVLIPSFRAADSVDCMVGYFSSSALAEIAPGLATFVNESSGTFRLIVSPYLRPEDRQAIERGIKSVDQIAADALSNLLLTEDWIERHTLACLSYLLKAGRIEMRIALMKNALFHPKVWMFHRGEALLAAHGSCNMTGAGIRGNFEQICVSRSWADPSERYVAQKLAFQFSRLWEEKEDDCLVIGIPQALSDQIIQNYSSDVPPTEADLRALYRKAAKETDATSSDGEPIASSRATFSLPKDLRYEDGPFAHQGRAVKAWCEAGFRGVLEMATGSGKTVTALICAHRLFEIKQPLLIVIAAPFVPLIDQWCREVENFGLKPINLTTVGGLEGRTRALQSVKRRLSHGLSSCEVLVVSHDTLCSAEFVHSIDSFECDRLLVADEVHNLGRPTFIKNPPECFEYRLALSATPVRQYDPDGTEAVFTFFGPVVFRFSLEDAIGRCLVEYEYFVHPVHLATEEMELWQEITEKIAKSVWRAKSTPGDDEAQDYLAKLYRDRRVVLETASAKIDALSTALDAEDLHRLKHTLIYASDKQPEQLLAINRVLQSKGVIFHQLTAEETADRKQTQRIIEDFQSGAIQVLTAKRVLDEGIDIPQICKAFILASTTVERQWIQRRGRLLRNCSAVGKTYSIIHDFIALPPRLDKTIDDDARKLVQSELRRVQEFARLARNAGRPNGPLPTIRKLLEVFVE